MPGVSLDLNGLARKLRSLGGEGEGRQVARATIYETDRSLAAIYLLRPGQRIPPHRHSAIDDVFLGVAGRGRVRTWGGDGRPTDHQVGPGTLVVVEPGTAHEVSCAGEEFCYVLTQSPKDRYDFLDLEAPEAGDDA